MIPRRAAPLELVAGPHDRVDLTAETFLGVLEPAHRLPQADVADDQEIDVAIPLGTTIGQGAEHKRQVYAVAAQPIADDANEAFALGDKFAQRPEKRVAFVCAEVPSIAAASLEQDVGRDQPVHRELHRSRR